MRTLPFHLPRRLRAPALLALFALVGCASSQEPGLRCDHGRVFAADPVEAHAVASDMDAIAPRVAAFLPGSDASDLTVWIVDRDQLRRLPGPKDAVAKADPEHRRVFLCTLGTRPADGYDDTARDVALARRADLAHELVHVMLGPEWRVLPEGLEEGLADWVACQLVPGSARDLRLNRLLGACSLHGDDLEVNLRIADGSFETRPPVTFTLVARVSASFNDEAEQEVYSSGFVVAARLTHTLGLDGLHRLCAKAVAEGHEELPAAWISRAAGFDVRDPWAMRRAAVATLSDDELLWIAEQAFHRKVPAEQRGQLLGVSVGDRDEVLVRGPKP